jgi:(2Fe-2S) ferredoxin
MSQESFELPIVYRCHVFCCVQQRPPQHPRGSCVASGAAPLWERLSARIQSQQPRGVAMTSAGCLGFCSAGPLMVVYPEGVWYQPRTTADIDEIFESHLLDGKLVERLVIVPRP